MKLSKESLIYDISNLAFVIAEACTPDPKSPEYIRITDICEEGNIDRVARVLGLAYANVADALAPVTLTPSIPINHDYTKNVKDYEFRFRDHGLGLTLQKKFKIKETVREYMVCMVITDWLRIAMPKLAIVWNEKVTAIFEIIKEAASSATSTAGGFVRRVPPM